MVDACRGVAAGVVRGGGPASATANNGSSTDASNNLTSSGHKLHRLRTLGHAHDVQRNSTQQGRGRIEAGGDDGNHTNTKKSAAASGLDKYFAKMQRREAKGPEIVDRRAMLVKSASTGTIHRISMPVFRRPSSNGIRSSIRSSFSRSSSRPSSPTCADPEISGTTMRPSKSIQSILASGNNIPSGDCSLGRTMSESALSPMAYKKSSMTVRTLDESLGRAGPEADESLHRRRQLRHMSAGISRVASADGPGSTTPRCSMYDSLRRSGSVGTLNESIKSSLSVSFHNVRIREYPMTVGDNPAVSSGVAITMDWDPLEQGSHVVELDEYEQCRPERRVIGQMRIPPGERDQILRRSGHSRREMQRGLRASNIARRQRTETLGTLHRQQFDELREKASRAVVNVLSSKKKDERDLLRRSFEAERIRERERAEVWAEQERLAAIELAEIETILNREKDGQQPLHAQPVCIDEDEGDQSNIMCSEFNAVTGQAAIEAAAVSTVTATAAVAAGRAGSAPQSSTPSQAASSPRKTATPPPVEEEGAVLPETPKPDKNLKFLLISSARSQMKSVRR